MKNLDHILSIFETEISERVDLLSLSTWASPRKESTPEELKRHHKLVKEVTMIRDAIIFWFKIIDFNTVLEESSKRRYKNEK